MPVLLDLYNIIHLFFLQYFFIYGTKINSKTNKINIIKPYNPTPHSNKVINMPTTAQHLSGLINAKIGHRIHLLKVLFMFLPNLFLKLFKPLLILISP